MRRRFYLSHHPHGSKVSAPILLDRRAICSQALENRCAKILFLSTPPGPDACHSQRLWQSVFGAAFQYSVDHAGKRNFVTGSHKYRFAFARVLSATPNWLSLPEKRTKLPLRAGGILNLLRSVFLNRRWWPNPAKRPNGRLSLIPWGGPLPDRKDCQIRSFYLLK